MALDRVVFRRYPEQNAVINCPQFVADGQRFNFVHATKLCSKRALIAAHPLPADFSASLSLLFITHARQLCCAKQVLF